MIINVVYYAHFRNIFTFCESNQQITDVEPKFIQSESLTDVFTQLLSALT